MDDDPYAFCHEIEKDAAAAFDRAGLAAFEKQIRQRFEAASADPSSWPYRHCSIILRAFPEAGLRFVRRGTSKQGSNGSFLGFIGLSVPSFDAPFTPCVEVGWRLATDCWGQGLATEGAREIVHHGFTALGLEEIVSFTVPANAKSRRVMEKLGMTHNSVDDFDHPRLPAGHPLRRHVLYRLNRSAWSSGFVNK
jgi:RimJ/RimL family protein N-acetyltransferase